MKCRSLPARADTVGQRESYDEILDPLMERAGKGEAALLFLDVSHFIMGCDFLGYIYGRVRRFVRTWSGRKRYNVLGAMDFITKKVHTVANDSYITATEICEMLRKFRIEYADRKSILCLTTPAIRNAGPYRKWLLIWISTWNAYLHTAPT